MADEYSLSDVLERMYQNQLGLEAALMELTPHAKQQGLAEVGDNVRGLVGDWRECWAYQARASLTLSVPDRDCPRSVRT